MNFNNLTDKGSLTPDVQAAEISSELYINESLLDVRDQLIHILLKRKWLILFIAIIGTFLTAAGTYLVTPLFKASSKIMVKVNVSQEVLLFDDFYQPVIGANKNIPANNFLEIAGSEIMARKIVEEFGLDEKLRKKREEPADLRETFWYWIEEAKDWAKFIAKYPYNLYLEIATGETSPEGQENFTTQAVNKFLENMLDIDLVAESDIINLSIWGESPSEAENIAKELAAQVIKRRIILEQNAANYGYNFSRSELEKAASELEKAEKQLQEFKQKSGISKIEKQKEIKLSSIDEIETSLITVNAELSANHARLIETETQMKEQKKLITSLNTYEQLLSESINLKVTIHANIAQKQEYESAKIKIVKELDELIKKQFKLSQLEREFSQKEDLYSQLSDKHAKLNIQRVSDLSGVDLRIIDVPELADDMEPDWPFWDLNMVIGVIVSLFCGVGIAIILAIYADSFWTGRQVEQKLHIPCLGKLHYHKWDI